MADIDKTLYSVLNASGTYSVYPLEKPSGQAVPCIIYKRVSGYTYPNHQKVVGLKRDRFQITCVADTYDKLRTAVAHVKSKQIMNNSNFSATQQMENQVEFKEEGLFYSISDFYILYL